MDGLEIKYSSQEVIPALGCLKSPPWDKQAVLLFLSHLNEVPVLRCT